MYLGSEEGLEPASAWSTISVDPGYSLGTSVASAGDVNGDGYSDVIVGVPGYEDGESSEGAAFVYHGSDTGLPATPSWITESNQTSARLGGSVASAGDVNADGYSDVIVGTSGYDNGETNEGAATVYYGSASGLAAAPAWSVESNQTGAQLGWTVAGRGETSTATATRTSSSARRRTTTASPTKVARSSTSVVTVLGARCPGSASKASPIRSPCSGIPADRVPSASVRS